jgi:hypothetical protein
MRIIKRDDIREFYELAEVTDSNADEITLNQILDGYEYCAEVDVYNNLGFNQPLWKDLIEFCDVFKF